MLCDKMLRARDLFFMYRLPVLISVPYNIRAHAVSALAPTFH